MVRPRALLLPTEDAITRAVIEHWTKLGTPGSRVASIPNKFSFGQAGLTRGLPDLLVISRQLGPKTGFIELKRERDSRSRAQRDIAEEMEALGIPYAVCIGRDEPVRQLEAWGAVRRSLHHA